MIRYLLDTNAVSDLVRNPMGRIEQQMALVGNLEVCTSIIVAAELRYGATRRGSARLLEQTELMLRRLATMPWDAPADRAYASLRTALEAAGAPIGQNDMLIAAHALALDCILVTDNEREFRRVPGLRVENWLRPA